MDKQILLADDSLTIQKVVELTFMDEPFEVTAVGSGDEAISRLEAEVPSVVIADVHMPGPSGYEVCRRAKEVAPGIPVLLLVGTFETLDEAELESCGADAHLKKPFDSQELLTRVQELAAAADAVPPIVAEESEPAVATAEGLEQTMHAGSAEEPEADSSLPDLDVPVSVPEPEEVSEVDELIDDSLTAGFDLSVDPPAAEDEEIEPSLPDLDADLGISTAVDEDVDGDEATAPEPLGGYPSVEDPEPEEAPEAEGARADGAPDEAPATAGELSDRDIERIARKVVELMSDDAVREVAWDVVPDMAEIAIKGRIRELEAEAE